MVANESVIFNEIPKGYPEPGKTLKKVEGEIDLDAPLDNGAVLLKTKVLSLDPYLRGRMRPAEIQSYVPAFELGAPIVNFGVGEVLKSENAKFKKGDHVYGQLQFSKYQVVPKDAAESLVVLENKEKLPWTVWVGAAGMPGQTAQYGLRKIAQIKKGDVVAVSGAMGPVGQVTIALAHKVGAKVIASAGSEEKVKFLKEQYGVERAFNYKTEKASDVYAEWNKEHGPFSIYVDNVGGEQLEAALDHIGRGGRIVAIGGISTYNGQPYGIKNLFHVVAKELKFEGFIILNHTTPEFLKEFYSEVPPAIADGSIPIKEHVFKGLDNGESFATLFDQENSNFGKAVISLE
ncbi:hypothetical protein Rhopal_004480-T1 [Rhodotorula paludigena]|uniref:Enoyl reductase (ER) domain-containing protein n=1 Tax=Rhodotorula paludigena TaxID=86838 RepID=A0AAV5GPN5_9BASI|nr:hypothetical protein Rhopal_004480-T1 [Rhodotorula paludigena]